MDESLGKNHRQSKSVLFKCSLCLLKDINVFKRGVPELSELTLHRFGLAPDRMLVTLTPPYLWKVLNTLFRKHFY